MFCSSEPNHPSRQNTNTGVLTREMWREVIREAVYLSKR
jgi:uracil-DNA glycosylase